MKFDAALMGVKIEESGSAARRAEQYGYDGVLSFEGPHDPFLPLVLAASATEYVDLTTAIAIAFARNPMTVAQMANDLQLISRGRFTLGLGTQIRPHIERRFSQTWSRPNTRMREFVQAVRAIWRSWHSSERLDFRGEFYAHTLMTPLFNPGANPHGAPPIHLAGFGPAMVHVAGEVADGWIVHPLHSPSFIEEVALPALHRGFAVSGRQRTDYCISSQTIVMLGTSDEQLARARDGARAQVAFYASTPAYRVMLDHHGWGDVQPKLNRLSKQGRWLDMMRYVTDDMLDVIGVSGDPQVAGAALRRRNAFADRTSLVLYDETGDADAVADLMSVARGGPR